MNRAMRSAIVAVATLGSILVFTAPAMSTGAQVTRGGFTVFAAGVGNALYDNLEGHAQMVRAAEGKTIVKVNVTGLVANTSYGSHVHLAACGTNNASTHYKFDPAGVGTPPNELWPAFTTDADGAGNGKDTSSLTAGPTAVSVVIHAPGGAKIACADLA